MTTGLREYKYLYTTIPLERTGQTQKMHAITDVQETITNVEDA
jgi:hypothetical protein